MKYMIVTLHLSDGRKITKDEDKLILFDGGYDDIPIPKDGYIAVNINHVVDMRPAEDDEIKHAEIHGW